MAHLVCFPLVHGSSTIHSLSELDIFTNSAPLRKAEARQRQGRGGDGNRPTGSLEAPTQARLPGSGERGRRDQPPLGYSRQFPMLTRGRKKMEAERSGLDNVIEEIIGEGGVQKEKGGAYRNGPK